MELLYWMLFCLPILMGYLYLGRRIIRKGDTTKKRILFRIAILIHIITFALIALSIILRFNGIIFRWNANWYISYMVILSGATVFLTLPKSTVHYLWWKFYSGLYYLITAIHITFNYLFLFIVVMLFGTNDIFENSKYIVCDVTCGSSNPIYHTNVIYEKRCVFLKALGTFKYDRYHGDIYNIESSDKDVVQVFLRQVQVDSLKTVRDSVLIVKKGNYKFEL